jgi:hypothetical protein
MDGAASTLYRAAVRSRALRVRLVVARAARSWRWASCGSSPRRPLTATVVPLELVYEHRNYFASMGVLLALADLLLLLPRGEHAAHRRTRRDPAHAGLRRTTHLRAREWSNPLRFAASEAHKRPQSPRSTYGYGRMLVIASRVQADSPLRRNRVKELERAIALPKSGILPHSALLLLACACPPAAEGCVVGDMTERLRKGPIGPQEVNAVGSIMRCARNGECSFSQPHMVAMFEAALTRPNRRHADDVRRLHPQRAARLRTRAGDVRRRDPDAPERIAVPHQPGQGPDFAGQARSGAQGNRDAARTRPFGENEAAAQDLERRLGACRPAVRAMIRAPRHGLWSGSAIYLVSNICNAAIPFLLLPILTRWLGTTAYGQVAMFQTLLGALAAVVGSTSSAPRVARRSTSTSRTTRSPVSSAPACTSWCCPRSRCWR